MKKLMPFVVLFMMFVMAVTCLAEENEGTCIDGQTYKQIKCEHFTHLESIPHNPKLLAEIEKMYPHAPEYVETTKASVRPMKEKDQTAPIILNLSKTDKKYPKQANRNNP